MKNAKRTVIGGILNHVYQRTKDGVLLFYNVSDYLVLFTIICTVAPKHGVRILALSLMPDHIHISVISSSSYDLSNFVADYSRRFSRVHNQTCHTEGPLFESPFGSVPVIGDKKARTNLCYVGNNGVERRLCKKAEEYRWSFLAYAISDHPFSPKLISREASAALRKGIKEIDAEHAAGKPLSYKQIKRLFSKLEKDEKLQLTDYIISTYNCIDYDAAIRYFDGYQNMLTAMHSNTGSEHDLNEVFIGKSDAYYAKMSSWIIKELEPEDIHDILAFPAEQKLELFSRLLRATSAPPEQVAKYLRIRLKQEGRDS